MIKFIYTLKIHLNEHIESTDLKHFNHSKAFVEYSNDIYDIYKNIEENNSNKKRKISIVFADMIADMLSNKKFNLIVTELFIRGRKYFSCFYHTILFCCSKKY